MAFESVPGMTFVIDADSRSGTATLRSFGATAQTQVTAVSGAAKGASTSFAGLGVSARAAWGAVLGPVAAVLAAFATLRRVFGLLADSGEAYRQTVDKLSVSFGAFVRDIIGAKDPSVALAAVMVTLAESVALVIAAVEALVRALLDIPAIARLIRQALVSMIAPFAALGAVIDGNIESIKQYAPAAAKLLEALQKIRAGLGGPTGTGKPGENFQITTGPQQFQFGFGLDGIINAEETYHEFIDTVNELNELFRLGEVNIRQYEAAIAALEPVFRDLVELGYKPYNFEIANAIAATEQHIEINEQARAVMQSFRDVLVRTAVAYVVGAIAGDKFNKDMLRSTLISIATEAGVQAIYELAKGYAASASGQYDKAAQHYAAAQTFGIIALGSALVARGLQSTTQTNTRPRLNRDDDTPAPPGDLNNEVQQNITIYIEGQGFIQDVNAFAQSIADSISNVNKKRGR